MKVRHSDRIGNGGLPSPSWASARRRSAISTAPSPTRRRRPSWSEAWESGCRYYDTAPLYGLGLAETRLNPFPARQEARRLRAVQQGRALLDVCPPEQRTGIGKFFDTPSRRERLRLQP